MVNLELREAGASGKGLVLVPKLELGNQDAWEPGQLGNQDAWELVRSGARAFQPQLFPPVFPEPWACEWGEDRFGPYMVLEVQGALQRFRWIEPGTFLMGSPEDEVERYEDEVQHEVTLTQGFWLADTACTQALWLAVMNDNPSRFKDDFNNPVESVSWNDAQGFIERLNQANSGLKARLPTDAQWEYACRAGMTSPFSFGLNITPEQVNYDGNHPYADGAKGEYRGKTVPVKSMPANPWGLYEMHGNVWEWCQDWYGALVPKLQLGNQEALGNQKDPMGPDSGSHRVLRGGSWIHLGRYARSANRGSNVPAIRFDLIGFRLALG